MQISTLKVDGTHFQTCEATDLPLVAHRTRQFEAWLTDRLENFTIHQEGQVSRIPKQVRGMTLREFGEKYQGNVQLALKGFQREKIAAAGGDSSLADIDKSMRKRKRVAQEAEGDALASPARASKSGMCQVRVIFLHSNMDVNSARTAPVSPKKVAGSSTGPGTAQRARLLATANKTSAQVCDDSNLFCIHLSYVYQATHY